MTTLTVVSSFVRSGGRGWLRVPVFTAMVLAVPVTAGSTSAATTTAPTTVARTEALLVGDSAMNGMAQPYSAVARWQLAVRHSFILDTAGCRRLITTSCHIGSGRTPTDALTALVARAGQFHRVLVVGAGYNDTTNGPTGVGAAIDVLIAEAHRQGVEHVVWLTYREAGPSATRYRAHNAVVRLKDIAYPELTVADWATLSATMPTSWFSADGIHLGAKAAERMADLIADAIDLLPSPSTANSCPGVAARAAAAGAVAVGPVQRPRVWCRRYPL